MPLPFAFAIESQYFRSILIAMQSMIALMASNDAIDFSEAGLSHQDLHQRLNSALTADLQANPIPGVYWAEVLHTIGDENEGEMIHAGERGRVYKRTYKVTTTKAGKSIQLGDRIAGFMRASFEKADTRNTPVDPQESDFGFIGDIELEEKATSNRIKIKVIQPGWGSSAYYPADVLKRDGPKTFTKGMQMFWNHDTAREASERPEGDLDRLSAVLATDAFWEKGALYAFADVKEKFAPTIKDIYSDIGVSIRAGGVGKTGKIEGREGLILQQFTTGKSVDFVTRAGAGGKIIDIFEAASRLPSTTTTTKENNSIMDEETKKLFEAQQAETKLLREAVTGMTGLLTATQSSNHRSFADSALARAVSESKLPEASKKKLLAAGISPVVESGVLSESKTRAAAAEVIIAEAQYLKDLGVTVTEAAAGANKGGTDSTADVKEADIDKEIGEAFNFGDFMGKITPSKPGASA